MTTSNEIGTTEEKAAKEREANKLRKRAERARSKAAKDAQHESLQEAWERHSGKLKHIEPALYARLSQRHEELEDLEVEISDCEAGRIEAVRHIAECWRDAYREFEAHGECNYGALDRREDFHPSAPQYDVSEPYKWFGFRTRLSADSFFRITKCFLAYALTTHDESLDPSIVDAAISEFAKQRFASRGINPQLILLIRVFRGLPANESPLYEFLTASDGYCQKVPRSIAEAYRTNGIVFKSPAQLERLADGRRNMEQEET